MALKGGVEVVTFTVPAVVSADKGLNKPRLPTLPGIMQAKKKPLETLDAAGVGIDTSLVGGEGSRVQCAEFHAPPAKASGQIIEDEDTGETVEKIVAWLDERKLI